MFEKKTCRWFVRDGKRKRTPKTSPVVPIPKEPTTKIVVKGIVKGGGIDLTKVTFETFVELSKASATKDQSSSVPTESVKETETEGVARDDSSEADDESTETETELDLTTLGLGKAQLKNKPTKKKKGSDEEDKTYTPLAEEKRS
ncbi:hypothetical protein Hanom_Chr12g01134411 [Helianthus anomalus]